MPGTDFDPLSERECYAVQLIARGKQLKEIAQLLGVEQSTARTFTKRAFTKLHVRSRLDAVMKHQKTHSFCGVRFYRRV